MPRDSQEQQKPQPFASLIAASSLITAALFVAGFSYRWSFYYNFGVPQIVYGLSLQSFLIAAIEMIREPLSLIHTIFILLLVTLSLEVLFVLLIKISRHLATCIPKGLANLLYSPPFDFALAADCTRGAALLLAIFALASSIGYSHFLTAVEDSPNNSVPLVTAILSQAESGKGGSLGCGTGFSDTTAVIGDLKGFREKMETNSTCNLQSTGRWRLLYRDLDYTYLYASLNQNSLRGSRPLTLVLPSSSIQGILLQ
jgi:hypothetical protein